MKITRTAAALAAAAALTLAGCAVPDDAATPVGTSSPSPLSIESIELAAEPAEPAEPQVPRDYARALDSAESYLNFTAFSRSGLADQLAYEGYGPEAAEYAVANVGADWNEQAARSAESYLDYTSFSRQGLVDQLLYEGFTPEQAEYGVSVTY